MGIVLGNSSTRLSLGCCQVQVSQRYTVDMSQSSVLAIVRLAVSCCAELVSPMSRGMVARGFDYFLRSHRVRLTFAQSSPGQIIDTITAVRHERGVLDQLVD